MEQQDDIVMLSQANKITVTKTGTSQDLAHDQQTESGWLIGL